MFAELPADLIVALAGVVAVAIVSLASLSGWRGWLALRNAELTAHQAPATPAAARIEIADMKERIRKLEAIAAGVDY